MTLYFCCGLSAFGLLVACIIGVVLLRRAPVEQWPGQYG